MIMAFWVSFFPIKWAMEQNTHEAILLSIGFLVGVFLISFSLFLLLMNLNLKFKIVSFFRKIIALLFLLLPGVMYLANLVPYVTVKKALTEADLLAFFKSYKQEAITYFTSNVDWNSFAWVSIIFILFVFSAIFCIFKQKNTKKPLSKVVTLLFGLILSSSLFHNTLTEPIERAITKLQEYREFSEKAKMSKGTKKIMVSKQNADKGIFVIVIGESQHRGHMSVYGYNRPTTPFLDSKKDNHTYGDWVFLDNPYASYTHTVEVMTWALTNITSFNQKKLSESKNIIDILNDNGYQIWWISNQKKTEPLASMVSQSQHQLWLNEPSEETDPYDEIILDKLPQEIELNNSNSVIFIHLMGNHMAYVDRYPNEWNKFGNSATDRYDNSILYNDYIVSKIYNHFLKMKNFSALVYMSDHADDVDSGFCSHNASLFTWDMVKIPFYAFFSRNYIKKNYKKIQILRDHKNKPFVNEMLFDFLLGIIGIQDESYRPENDLSNKEYNHSVDDLFTLLGQKRLSKEGEETALKNRFKIYLRRVNSPQKLEELREKYVGFELDIIYHEEEDAFENSHDKNNLKEYPLEATLKYYRDWQYLWLDFKNLTLENQVAAKKCLDELSKKYNISKSKVWLESSNLEALEVFTNDGWNTSYRLPYYNFDKVSTDKSEKIKSEIEAISYSGKIRAISFADNYYSFVNSLTLNPNVSLLIWFDEKTFEELKDINHFLSILQNPRVKTVLVEEHGKYHR